MRFERIELCNWDIQANQVLLLQPGVNLLTGENGSGKTSILDAIKVALGVVHLGGGRNVDDYLRGRDAPRGMVRIVADNRPDPATRRRPFHTLGGFERDLVTIAVVFEASDEGYERRFYLADGDVSPLAPGFAGRPFASQKDFRERLAKLGMGDSFAKLLRTPQGQIASLCAHPPAELFDLLFDFVGGKEVLDEWLDLRARFVREEQVRRERSGILVARERELELLGQRLAEHQRFQRHLVQAERAEQALPWSRVRAAERRLGEIAAGSERQRASLAEAEREAAVAQGAIARLRERQAALQVDSEELRRAREEAWREEGARRSEHAACEAEFRTLDELRVAAAGLPARDAGVLRSALAGAEDQRADARVRRTRLQEELRAAERERDQLERGLLAMPEGVEAFRDALVRGDVPHHLLLDLIEPLDPPEALRHALESFLGDLRFAVAVPDVESFRRAVALAREHHFPYAVLSPDVRSPAPTGGEHPFLDRVRVSDPRYQGLLHRVLRHVGWLEGPVEDTWRQRGARVDADGFVLDRQGGRWQGAERHYLGRAAIERRRAELVVEFGQLGTRSEALDAEAAELARSIEAIRVALAEEERRQRWLASVERYAHLGELLERLTREMAALRARRGELDGRRDAVQADLQASARARGQQEHELAGARGRAQQAERNLASLGPDHQGAQRALAEARADAGDPAAAPPEVLARAAEHEPAYLEAELSRERVLAAEYHEVARDPNLPGNHRTLERQVLAVRGELARLAEQVDEARAAAERAHEQYRRVTRRIFRRYFALLREEGLRLGFAITGDLRSRDDGRFDVEISVGVGDKEPVSYRSPSLSGGQKAALSILLAMTTLRVDQHGEGAGFFLVDEPFSASDTHKIQELGTFLELTGAQYIVSMPTSAELRRAGSWLRGVLTCTATRGGVDEAGQLRLAPPVKCSIVVRDAG